MHRLFPQMQAAEFASVPSVFVQTGPERQMQNLEEDMSQATLEVSVGLKLSELLESIEQPGG